MKHMAVTSVAPNIVIAWRIAADTENNTNTHRKSLLHIIASAIALMAVVETVPKAVKFAPKAVTKIVAIHVVIVVAAVVMQTLAFAKYSAVIESIHNSNKG